MIVSILMLPLKSPQWYARHLMWHYASQLRPDLEYVNETDDERPRNERGEKVFKLKKDEYEQCLRRINENLKYHWPESETPAVTAKTPNNDDALVSFNKTLPGASSLVDFTVGGKSSTCGV